MSDILLQDELTEKNGQQDTDGRANEIQQMRVGKRRVDDMVIYQVADAMRQLLDDDGGSTSEEARRDAEYQHETTVTHVRRPPCVEAVNPSVEPFLEFHLGGFSYAESCDFRPLK